MKLFAEFHTSVRQTGENSPSMGIFRVEWIIQNVTIILGSSELILYYEITVIFYQSAQPNKRIFKVYYELKCNCTILTVSRKIYQQFRIFTICLFGNRLSRKKQSTALGVKLSWMFVPTLKNACSHNLSIVELTQVYRQKKKKNT